jgi:dimethylamine/trimethylamine dehydrogenase
VLTADDILDGARPSGRVVVFDDDHYYMGGVVASALVAAGARVTLVTPEGIVAAWSSNTEEQRLTQMRLLREGVKIEAVSNLTAVANGSVEISCIFTGQTREIPADHVVMVTSREPNGALYGELCDQIDITRVGDCSAPGIIAAAVMAGHRYAREMDAPEREVPFRRDEPSIELAS